jgi:predicted Rossmann fold nucleotide-binding protein DprA/Smf involved in DNA uptake
MTPTLSANTQAILLLTAPLIAGRGSATQGLLTPGEYKRLARHLREIQHEPADLVSPNAPEIFRACQPVIDETRLQKLLARGFLLSQVIERWQARAIWVISRADADYPRRLKARLREDAPAVLYGCGDMSLLDSGGLAVVGSRHVDDTLIDYTIAVGRLAVRAGRTLVSGGARGIDQAAMRGALEAGGKVCGVLADSLEKTTMNREHRNLLLEGQLTLISPYDPSAGFNVGNAMQRNKLIYALAVASLVVSSDLNKGGTWAGAVEQLDKLRLVPVYVRLTGESSAGLDALRKKGALPWPNPENADSFDAVFNVQVPTPAASVQARFPLSPGNEPDVTAGSASALRDTVVVAKREIEQSETVGAVLEEQAETAAP